MQLFPKNYDFFKLFDRQVEQLHRARELISQIPHADRLDELARTMKDIEHDADKITHEIFQVLNQTFITPIDREDIILLASRLDDIIDETDRVVNRMALYKIDHRSRVISQYISLLDKAFIEVGKAVSELHNAHKTHDVLKHCEIINFIENEIDDHNTQAIGDLLQNATNAIEVIKLKEIYETLEDTADRCEDVANVLETIVLKNQ